MVNHKRGQTKLSFGMIFSILLIIFFLAFAFYGIKKFMSISDVAQLTQFKDKVQEDVNKLWKGSQGSQTVEYSLPSGIQKICFIDYSDPNPKGRNSLIYTELRNNFMEFENLFFYPKGSSEGLDSFELKHLNLEESVIEENPLCFDNEKGKVYFRIEKDFGESVVRITKP